MPSGNSRARANSPNRPNHWLEKEPYYAWKSKFGGLEVGDAKRLPALEDENAKLKRLLTDAMLDNVGLMNLLTKIGDARPQS